MKIKKGEGTSKYGTGVEITLTGEEVALAIETFLTARNVHISGSRTIYVNEELCASGSVYIDSSAIVIAKGNRWDCRTGKKVK